MRRSHSLGQHMDIPVSQRGPGSSQNRMPDHSFLREAQQQPPKKRDAPSSSSQVQIDQPSQEQVALLRHLDSKAKKREEAAYKNVGKYEDRGATPVNPHPLASRVQTVVVDNRLKGAAREAYRQNIRGKIVADRRRTEQEYLLAQISQEIDEQEARRQSARGKIEVDRRPKDRKRFPIQEIDEDDILSALHKSSQQLAQKRLKDLEPSRRS